MRTILIPVDATPTTENAVRYAVEWAKKYGYGRIILLKSSYESMFGQIAIGASYGLANEASLAHQETDAESLLGRLRDIIAAVAPTLKMTAQISNLPLLRSVIALLKSDRSIGLVILGSDHEVISNESFVSANVIRIARASPVNVLIVPENHAYRPVKTILIPCDTKSIGDIDKLARLKSLLQQDQIRLMLLKVDTKAPSAEGDGERKAWEEAVRRQLPKIPHSLFYVFDKQIIDGVLSFSATHGADLVIALPGKHSFLYYLANKSISEGIYRNADRAVLILKETPGRS